MNRVPRILPIFLALSAATTISPSAFAQTPSAMPPGISQYLSSVADQPATHTGFVFDRSMLEMARGLLQTDDPATRRAAASVSSVSFDNYRYVSPAIYTPETMSSIATAYQTAGWKHLVNGRDRSAEPGHHPGTMTDLWLHFTGSDVDGVTVIARRSRDMNVIQVACDLRPLDLLRLSGHFGIPKIDPDAVMVPAPDNR